MGSTRLSGSQRGRFAVLALGVVLTLAMVGCGAEEATETPAATGTRAATAEATTAGATIQVRNAWARPSRMAGAASPATHDGMAMEGTATPSMGMEGTATVAPEMQNGGTSAIFMTIQNTGDTADRLIRASANVAETVELHRSTVEDGVMRMRPVEAIEIPAGGSVELKPGDYHIMLINLTQDLNVGDQFTATLEFEQAGTIEVEVEVREPVS